MRVFIIQVHDPVIHLEVDEEQQAITRGGKRQAERTGFLAPLLVRATIHRCSSCMDLAMVRVDQTHKGKSICLSK